MKQELILFVLELKYFFSVCVLIKAGVSPYLFTPLQSQKQSTLSLHKLTMLTKPTVCLLMICKGFQGISL